MLPDCNRRDSAFFDMESQQTDVEDESIQTDVLNVTSTGVIDLTALAQCPTRASSALSCEHGSSHKRQRVFRASDIDLLPSQIGRDSVDTFNPALDVESQDTLASGYNKFCMAETPQMTGSTPERQVEVQLAKTPTIRSEQGVILRDELQEEPLTEPASDPILYIQEKIEETQPPSEAEDQKRRTCSLPDGDLATKACQKKTATNVHRYATVNTLLRIDQPHSGDEITSHDAGSGGEGILPGTKSDKSSVQTEQAVAKDREMGPRALEKQLLPLPEGSLIRLRRHKRNLAALRISTSNLLRGVNEGYPHLTPSCSTAPLLAPKPISPARQLKVKNSIPRLMKALPPIPGDPDFVPSVESNALDEEDDFLEILAPLSLSGALAPRSLRKKDPVKLDLVAATSHTTRSNLAQPRLRVKMKSSDKSAAGSSSEHNPWPLCDADTATVSAMPPGQTLTPQLATPRRLKIRSARGTRSHSPIQSTVRRDPAQESDVGASLAKLSKHDLFVGGSPSNTRTRPRVLKKALPGDHIRVCSSSGFMASSKTESLAMMKRASKDGVKDTAFSSGRPHRLKKRLSNMKTLLSGPHEHHWHPIDRATARSALPYRKESSPGDDNMTVRSVETGKSEAIRRNLSPPLASRTHIRRRVRIRLSRWVKGAKTAVKSYTKKSHSL